MLRAVGHPVAVNPDGALEKIARAEGWRIMRFDRLGPILKIGAATLGRRAGGRGRRLRGGAPAPAARLAQPVATLVPG